MGSPAIPPPGGQPQQQTAEPPSWKKILLGMIPVAGPLLVAHGQQEYERKLQKEQQTIAGKAQPYQLATNYATNQDLDPDTRLGWQQLQADMAIHNEENYTRPYTPEHVKRFQDLLGKTNSQLAMKQQQAQSNLPSALLPPPGSQPPAQPTAMAGIPGMMPQGSGPARVNAPPPESAPPDSGSADIAIPPPPGAQPAVLPAPSQQQGGDPMSSLIADAQSPNPLIKGPAINQLRAIRTSMITAQAMMARGMQIIEAYKNSGAEQAGVPYSQFVETMMGEKATAAPMVVGKPGEVVAGPTGVPKFSVPQPVTTAPGAVTNMVTPQPASVSLTPPPGGTSAADIAGTQIAAPPPQLNAEETRRINAARVVASKYGFLFDPSLNPRNPSAQIPQQYLPEFEATDKTMNEDPELKKMRMDSAANLQAFRAFMEGTRRWQENFQTEGRLQQSRIQQSKDLEKLGQPVEEGIKNWSTVQSLMDANDPQADSLLAPAVIKAVVGGAGSNVRINQAEIKSQLGSMNKWTDLQAYLKKWQTDPNRSVLPQDKRDQLYKLGKVLSEKLLRKQKVIQDANDSLATSNDLGEHLKIVNQAKKDVDAVDKQTLGAGLTPPPAGAKVATKAHVADYAQKKGITSSQANKEFTDAGYTIQ